MNVTKHGIYVDNQKKPVNLAKIKVHNKQRDHVQFDQYVEMVNKRSERMTVVTPYDAVYILQLESEGYRIVRDFEIYRKGVNA